MKKLTILEIIKKENYLITKKNGNISCFFFSKKEKLLTHYN